MRRPPSRSPRLRRRTLALALLFAACRPSAEPRPADAGRPAVAERRSITILATGDVGGDPKECGCKVHPQGGLARRVRIVDGRAAERSGATLTVDAGDLFFGTPFPPPAEAEAARELARLFARSLARMHTPAMAVGERDLALGLPLLRELARTSSVTLLASNLVFAKTGTAAFAPYAIAERAGVKVGLVGAALELGEDTPAHQVYAAAGLALRPIEPALSEAAKAARAAGAEVVVGLLHVGMNRAREVVSKLEPGLLDLAFVAHDRAASTDVELVEETGVAMTGERGKHVFQVDLEAVRGGRGVRSLGAIDGAKRSLSELEARITALEHEDAGTVDPALKERLDADRRAMIGRLERRRAQVASELGAVTTAGHHRVRSSLVSVDVDLPEDPTLAVALDELEARLQKAKAGGADGPGYVGSGACKRCHEEAYAEWLHTRHAKAWSTMERTRQTTNLECVGCHTTGFDRPGGPSDLKALQGFVNVGCESCHGPSSRHVERPEVRTPTDLKAPGLVCTECHRVQAEQKPFVLTERLPKVLGPGHGAPGKKARRAAR